MPSGIMGRMWTLLLKRHWLLLPILALALAVRLIPLWAVQANGGSPLIGDEGNYVEAAQALAGGVGIPDRWIWIRPPGYIAFLASIFRLTDNSLVAAQVAQIAVSLLTVAATYWLAAVGGGRWAVGRGQNAEPVIQNSELRTQNSVAAGAAGIMAVQPSLIFATGLFLTETLFLLLVTALLGALLAYR
ncbi:MAG: hypothetical protein M3Z04_00350, partial [Chloroflexota bacterium]|nr:hypothetical protein [Chloroflexota bacterium]